MEPLGSSHEQLRESSVIGRIVPARDVVVRVPLPVMFHCLEAAVQSHRRYHRPGLHPARNSLNRAPKFRVRVRRHGLSRWSPGCGDELRLGNPSGHTCEQSVAAAWSSRHRLGASRLVEPSGSETLPVKLVVEKRRTLRAHRRKMPDRSSQSLNQNG